ncbi:MAG: (2Fe-2S) ferredoxin domain-containing protein [Planctomycetales bacterium]
MTTDRSGALGQLLVCEGCCCGHIDRGHPPVPRDWLKSEWKSRKLNATIQLTISGCLGPCDLANVVWIVGANGESHWLGNLTEHEQYESLLDWATRCQDQARLQDLPDGLMLHAFDRFAHTEHD